MSTATATASTSVAKTAAEIAGQFNLSEDARNLIQPRQASDAFLAVLIEGQFYLDALRFVAYKLPKREAVWWACLCLWQTYRTEPEKKTSDALEALVRWVQEPNEENRRAADAAGKVAGVATPEGSLAAAVFFSGGSISLPDCPEVEPAPLATAQNVASAVVVASKKTKPDRIAEHQRRFLVLAADVASGRVPWESTPAGDE